MKNHISPDWCMKMSKLEDNAQIGAGILALDPMTETSVYDATESEVANVAFGRLVNLMRRKSRLTIEDFANRADIDIAELVEIEDDPKYRPEPRTVHMLADYLKISRAKLFQLAGLTEVRDTSLTNEAVRFAARSNSIADLEPHERQALEAFVKIISEDK